ncbi:MAG TPA: hypothetical protein VE685_16065 [Thermoanaerobaculia bacterium]|nr:hypothetical protein [Thermoanaerobaculia bacterium]
MTLLDRVVEVLRRLQIPHALIGASAMTVHGLNRNTLDVDLLALDPACFDPQNWAALRARGVNVEITKGDLTDPLAGVVRFETPGERSVDLVLGKFTWQKEIIERSPQGVYGGTGLPIVTAADLILLKLYAGGPQDAWDILQTLEGPDREILIAAVEKELPRMPEKCSSLWKRILESGF